VSHSKKVRVGVNGYGVIGKRVAAAVASQEDIALTGVSDVVTDWRAHMVLQNGFRLFGATADAANGMRDAGLEVAGTLDDLLGQVDVVVDCTPKKIAAKNVDTYRRLGIKFILQGGEKHAATGHSFVAECNYASAIGREATRVVSCNTTSVVRTLTALKRAGLLRRARGTLLRRATDPWESHESGIMNTLVPEPEIPSHQGPDAQTVDPELDVVTMAVKVPETLAHLHYWSVQLTREATKDEVLDAFLVENRADQHRGGSRRAQLGEGADGRSRSPARQSVRGGALGGHASRSGRRAVLCVHGRQPGDRDTRNDRRHSRADGRAA
jgi:glyceraldehyde-3-phosphate dehydrogenase (NAD(P))